MTILLLILMVGHASACVYTVPDEIKLAIETEEKKDKADSKKYEIISFASNLGLGSKIRDSLKFITFSIDPKQAPVQDKHTPPPDRA